MRLYLFIAAVFLSVIFFDACKKTETPSYPSLTQYFPLQTGTSLNYRLDSLVLVNFGTSFETHSYILKDSIESTFNDNAGRLSYRVYRFITDTLQSQPFQYLSTYFITPTATTIEVVDDNNDRFIKLAAPITQGLSWQGNTFIDTKSANSTLTFLDGWNYTYNNVNEPYTVAAGTIDSTISILQDTSDVPNVPFSTSLPFYEHIAASEVYAKNIGLIYKEFTHWTFQQNLNPGQSGYADGSYGLMLSFLYKN